MKNRATHLQKMASDDVSGSETDETEENSSSDEPGNPNNGETQAISEYEKQRLSRIAENRARLEALGLPKMASSLMGSVQLKQKQKQKQKGKAKVVEDEDYTPPVAEEGSSSSNGDDDDDEKEFAGGRSSGARVQKVKNRTSKPKKKVPVQKISSNSEFVDDDDALKQAIALSLKDCPVATDRLQSGPSQSSDAGVLDDTKSERKGKAQIQEGSGRRKRKKPITSRVQMTEDELVIHFFQFDEAGKGGITLRDLQRMAYTHDFTWTDKEMADMIHCFDSDGDGKLSLEDFQKIVSRCNMLQRSETDNAGMGSKS
ncbi:uncharacterized protein LOC100262506 [Vitis vinifera]|nr:uncharacterized protein LOC100262506 [Vitis vinifera]|eukprot:XP_010661681.1 PREDICTED: uncharacterized protein LOC100262506 [Vitis vinifera]